MEQAHEILLKHHEKTQELEYRQQKSVHNLREEQIIKQHASELQNQTDYSDRAEKELLRKHALELKQQPKSLKVRGRKGFWWKSGGKSNFVLSFLQQKELQIRKQFRETIKTQERQYKALKAQILQTTPKDEQKVVIKRLKEDKQRKLTLLGEQVGGGGRGGGFICLIDW